MANKNNRRRYTGVNNAQRINAIVAVACWALVLVGLVIMACVKGG